MSRCNMVHKPIPIPKAMTNPEAMATPAKGMETLQKLPAWDECKVTCKAEVIRQAKLEGKQVFFIATLMDLCHLKNSELEKQFQRYKGRVWC